MPRLPSRVIDLPPDAQVLAIALSPDGRTLYVEATVYQANVWAILVYYWPEMAGILLVLGALVYARRLLRRGRRIVGEPYCRRCGYWLRGLDGTSACPECGIPRSPRNIIAGTRRRWRLAVAAGLVVAAALGYALGGEQLPRDGQVGEWFEWRSQAVATWEKRHGAAAVMRRTEPRRVLVAAVPSTGKVVRTFANEASSSAEWSNRGLVVSPDGARVYRLAREPRRVEQYDAASGRLLRTLVPSPVPRRPGELRQLSTSLDGATVYAVAGQTLVAWDAATGQALASYAEKDRHLWVVPLAQDAMLFLANMAFGRRDSVIHDPRAGRQRAVRLGWELVEPPATDGTRLYTTDMWPARQQVRVWDLATGEEGQPINVPVGGLPSRPGVVAKPWWNAVRIHAGGRFLSVVILSTAGDTSVYLYDLSARQWVGPAAILDGIIRPPVEVIPAAGFIVAPHWSPKLAGPKGGYDPNRRSLAVFDVPEWKP